MKQENDWDETCEVDDLPVSSAVVVLRPSKCGSLVDLPDEELADPEELEQQMMAQAGMGQPQGDGEEGGDDHGDEGQGPPPASTGDKTEDAKKMEAWIKENYESLQKTSKSNHNRISKILLGRHKELVDSHLTQWKEDSRKALKDIEEALGGKDDDKE